MINAHDEIMGNLKFKPLYPEQRITTSDDDIGQLEAKLGQRLPSDYRRFLLKYGVTASDQSVFIPNIDSEVEVFYGINPDGNYDLGAHWHILSDRLGSVALPIATSPCGEICILLVGKDAGAIYWWNREGKFGPETATFVAKDFGSFLTCLTNRGGSVE